MKSKCYSKWISNIRHSALLAAACLLTAVLLLTTVGCGESESALQEEQRRRETAQQLCGEQLEALCSDIIETLPPQYTSEVSLPTVSSSDAVSGSDISQILAQTEQKKLELLQSAAISILNDMAVQADKLADENGRAAIEQEKGLLEAELLGAESVKKLYESMLLAETRLFGCAAVEASAENEEQMKIIPSFFRDGEQQVWLCVNTNFALPGFGDANRGFSLRLLLENGREANVCADSIYSRQFIEYDGAYSVRFNLSGMLSSVGTEAFFAGRNRVNFSYFATDNSFEFYQSYYRMACDNVSSANCSDAWLELLCIAAENI